MLPAVNDNDAPKNDAKNEKKRDEILDRIAAAVSSAGMNPVRDDSVVKIVSSFSKVLQENNKILLENLVQEDKTLLLQTVKELSNLQAKTTKEFAEKIDKSLKFAERLILRGESENKPELREVGEKLKQSMYDEKFKALGIDDDPTLGQRVKRRVFGKINDVDAEGNKVSGWVQGKSILRNAGSSFASGFSQNFMGGAFAGVSKSNEQRRNEIREQTDRENKRVAFLEESQQNLLSTLDNSGQANDTVTKGGGEETTQLRSANISPDTKTRSDLEELKAGIRDTDPAFSRSSTLLGEQNYWPQLLKLLEDIKKCVCECQCTGGPGMDMLPNPAPVRTPTSAPTRVPTATPTRVPTAVPVLENATVRRPMALPAPAAVEAQGLARQISQARPAPALEYKPNNGTPLNFETRTREKVPVRARAEPVYQAKELSVAERLSRGIIGSADEAIRTFREERAAGKTIGAAEAAPKMTPRVEPEVAASRERPRDAYRPGETREQWTARREANAAEDALQRRIWEQEQANRWNQTKTASTPGSTSRALVPVKGTVEPAAKPSMWERAKSATGKAWESTKSFGKTVGNKASGALESVKGFGSSAWGKVSGAAERFGNWSANTRVGKAVVGAAESPTASKIGSVASKVANSGAVKWGGRGLSVLGVGVDVYNRKKEGQTWGKVGAGVGSGLAGAALGAKGGAALGGAIGSAFFGVGAVPGAAIGGFLGGVGGYFAGSGAGDWIYDKVMGKAEPVKQGDKPRPAVATANGARQAPAAAISQQRPRASVQSGQNQDSSIISRSTAAVATAKGVAERPVINVPPPTVIQAPPNPAAPIVPNTPMHSRPDDNSWLTWQRKRTAALA